MEFIGSNESLIKDFEYSQNYYIRLTNQKDYLFSSLVPFKILGFYILARYLFIFDSSLILPFMPKFTTKLKTNKLQEKLISIFLQK